MKDLKPRCYRWYPPSGSDSWRIQKKWDALKGMKAILIGGAPLADELWNHALVNGFPLSPTYGLTEMGSQVAALSPKDFLGGEHGLEILSGRKAKICQRKIILSGVGQMLGFFEKGCLVKSGKEIFTQDEGILVRGRLKILGRADRIIISGGKKIDPQPLEFLLLKCSGIEEAVLVGLPDGKWGERLHLAYTGRPGLSLDDIRNFLQSRVAPWEMPRGISHCRFLSQKGGCKPGRREIVRFIQGQEG